VKPSTARRRACAADGGFVAGNAGATM